MEIQTMRFKDPISENLEMRENLGAIVSLGAIFIQIWILSASVHSLFLGKTDYLGAALILSGLALFCCALCAWTTLKRINLPK